LELSKVIRTSENTAGAAIGRPAADYYNFAETIGKFATYYRRASNARPYNIFAVFLTQKRNLERGSFSLFTALPP